MPYKSLRNPFSFGIIVATLNKNKCLYFGINLFKMPHFHHHKYINNCVRICLVSVLDSHSTPPSVVHGKPVGSPPYFAQSGFSVMELMVVIAILGVVTTLAVPSIQSSLERQRNKNASQAIASALKEARNEALFRHQDIKVTYIDGQGLVVSAYNKSKTDAQNYIRTYPVGEIGVVEVNPAIIIYGANKRIRFENNSNPDSVEYQTYCTTKAPKKVGRKVSLDKNGNISVKTEGSQC